MVVGSQISKDAMTTNIYRAPYYTMQTDTHPNSSLGYLDDEVRHAAAIAQMLSRNDASDKDEILYQSIDPLPHNHNSQRQQSSNHQWFDLTGVRAFNSVVKVKNKLPSNVQIMSTENNKCEYFNVYLDLSEKGLGMSIRGGIDSPDKFGNIDIYISRILAGGAVHQDGRLQIGMVYLNLNSTLNSKYCLQEIYYWK